ncbi:MAG: translocation/assembly module TamB domain-containing protein [Polyangiaceae bacterium]
MADPAPTEQTPAAKVAPKRAKKKRSLAFRIFRVVLIILLLPVLVAGGLVGYLHTDSGKARVRTTLEKRLSQRVNGSVTIGSLDYALGGEVSLGGVHVKDTDGNDVVVLDNLRVKPDWRTLLKREAIAIDEVDLRGLHLNIVKDADGGSNLKRLVIPSEEEPNKQPSAMPIIVRSIAISDVDVAIQSPDGTTIAIDDVALKGSLKAVRSKKDLELSLSPITLTADVKKTAAQGGLTVAARDFKTGVKIDLHGGNGTVQIEPLEASVALTLPGKFDHTLPVAWDGGTVEVKDGNIGATLDDLLIGAISFATIKVDANTLDGALAGTPAADVIGLHVDAAKLNELLGKPVLKANVDVVGNLDTSDPQKPRVTATVKTDAGATITATAQVDTSKPNAPAHDVRVTVTDVDTEALLAADLGAPPVKVESVTVTANGTGASAADLSTTTHIHVKGVTANKIKVEDVDADASVKGNTIDIARADVHALDQHIKLSGTFDREKKTFSADISLDGDIGVLLAALKTAGLPITAELPKATVELKEGDLKVHAEGQVGGDINVHATANEIALAGGNAKIDATAKLVPGDPAKGEKKIKVAGLDATIDLKGILLSRVLALRGKHLPPQLGFDALFGLHAHATGTVENPEVELSVDGIGLRSDKGPVTALRIDGNVDKTQATLALALDGLGVRTAGKKATRERLATVSAFLPLLIDGEKKGLDPARFFDINLELPQRPLEEVAKYVPPMLLVDRTIPQGELGAKLHFAGTVASPRGDGRIDFEGTLLDPKNPKSPRQTLAVNLDLTPDHRGGSALDLNLAVALEKGAAPILGGHVNAAFPWSPLLGGAQSVTYTAHLDVGPVDLGKLPAVEKLEKARAIGGVVDGDIDLEGDRSNLGGTIRLTAKGAKPPRWHCPETFNASLSARIQPETTTVDLGVDFENSPLVTLTGSLGIAGRGLLQKLKGLDPQLDLVLSVPSRSLASLSPFNPKLENLPGALDGKIAITGTAKNPLVSGELGVSKVAAVSGVEGGAKVKLGLDGETLQADVFVGAPLDTPPVAVKATIPRVALFDFVRGPEGTPLPISISATAAKADLKNIVPGKLLDGRQLDASGALDLGLSGSITIEKGKGVATADLQGGLDLAGTIPLPGTKRTWNNVALSVKASGEEIRIDRLEAHETDLEVKDRWLKGDGHLTLAKLKPQSADLHLTSDKWLLFGGKMLGQPDAPRGTLTLDARVTAEIAGAIKLVNVEVDKLELLIPDRFDKAHQPEDVAVGDVMYVGDADVKVGQLSVPESKKKKEEHVDPSCFVPPPDAPDVAAAEPESGMDLDVHIADGAHLVQASIDLTTGGRISVKRREKDVKIRGQLVMSKGQLQLGGALHDLREGSLTFDEAHPTGYLDLWFEKILPNQALRDVSKASAGDSLTVHTFGPLLDRKNVLGGSGSPGSLYDTLAVHTTGRERYVSGPDMPESATVDFPQTQGLLVLSFLSVNLPHLIFLDRVAAWSDPYDSDRSYGRIDHYEAERYLLDGNGRVRATMRPSGVGRSDAELEFDYLFVNKPRAAFGVGATGGSRGGGGAALVFEWSSDD